MCILVSSQTKFDYILPKIEDSKSKIHLRDPIWIGEIPLAFED